MPQAEALATREGKLLFVGEFGGNVPNFTGPTSSARVYPTAVLKLQARASALSVALDSNAALSATPGINKRSFVASAIWAWACPTHLDTMRCLHANTTLHPSYLGSEHMLTTLQRANRLMTSGDI